MDVMQPDLDNDDDLTEILFFEQRELTGWASYCANVISIVSQAKAERASEAKWNGDLYTALLKISIWHDVFPILSRWRELTTSCRTAAATDSDAFSHPEFSCPNLRIDFYIGLCLSGVQKKRLSRRTNAVNPTSYEPVRFAQRRYGIANSTCALNRHYPLTSFGGGPPDEISCALNDTHEKCLLRLLKCVWQAGESVTKGWLQEGCGRCWQVGLSAHAYVW